VGVSAAAPLTVGTSVLARGVPDVLLGPRLVVLTGAGLSTDSGIPDYRGPGSVTRAPMTYQEFISGPLARQRYWARSHLGWGRMRTAEANDGHRALARLDPDLLITQNVDGLHEAAGSSRLVALHGRIADVVCLSCRRTTSRSQLEERMALANQGFAEAHAEALTRPDGDVDLDETAGFAVPDCDGCGGMLKPDVVFFGENVPKDRVERCYQLVEAAGAVLVLGSSLTVLSGFRFVRHAARHAIPVAIVNQGATRGDPLAALCVDAALGQVLPALVG
jgi:NAD-dependent SIR2 family protein deacetylase